MTIRTPYLKRNEEVNEKDNKNYRHTIAPSVTLILMPQIFDIKSASALKVAMSYGHLNNLDPTPDYDEIYWESWACTQIDSYFGSNWGHQNAYGTLTTKSNVLNTLQYINNPGNGVTWATNWWVGDYVPAPGVPDALGHYGFNGDLGTYNNVFDYDIHKNANYYYWPPPTNWWQPVTDKQYFNFIWTCSNGGIYWNTVSSGGYTVQDGINDPEQDFDQFHMPNYTPSQEKTGYGYMDNIQGSGAVGMPYAWTGTTSMSQDGYFYSDGGSYAYIGWENNSPFLKNAETAYPNLGLQYGYYPFYFYRYALGVDNGGVHATIKQSLDYAAWKTFGNIYPGYPHRYDTSIGQGIWRWIPVEGYPAFDGWWYCKMRVFGNPNIVLPY